MEIKLAIESEAGREGTLIVSRTEVETMVWFEAFGQKFSVVRKDLLQALLAFN